MKPTLATILFTVCFLAQANAQREAPPSKDKAQVLLGINVTNTLAGFFNAGGQAIPKDPYLLSLKALKNNRLWRLGLNFKVDASQEETDFTLLDVKENEALLRIGREWQKPVNKRFSLYFGADAVGSYYDESSKFSGSSALLSKTTRSGIGFGPFLGVYLNLGERVRLSTETYAYGIYYYGKETTEIGPGVPDQVTNTRKLTILPAMPNSLYVHFIF